MPGPQPPGVQEASARAGSGEAPRSSRGLKWIEEEAGSGRPQSEVEAYRYRGSGDRVLGSAGAPRPRSHGLQEAPAQAGDGGRAQLASGPPQVAAGGGRGLTIPTTALDISLKQALRTLLLPIDPESEDDAVTAVGAWLVDHGWSVDDGSAWLGLQADSWLEGEEPSAAFQDVVGVALRAGNSGDSGAIASAYFELHKSLQSRDHGLSASHASLLLAHLGEMRRLAMKRSTAAQIAALLAVRDRRLPFSWRSVQHVLARLHMEPRLDEAVVEPVLAADVAWEAQQFADADDATAAALVEARGKALGFDGPLGHQLLALAPPRQVPFGPYLQILHLQALIAEFYDHDLTNLYEFSPRGKLANELFARYPERLRAGNPALNNAKAQARLDVEWARSRDSAHRPQAIALAGIATGMSDLGFTPRRDLALWVRAWLERQIRLFSQPPVRLPATASPAQCRSALMAIASGNTGTAGILEQRAVDAVAGSRHNGSSWRPRGVGDSVNASNFSRRKLGDCDFQSPASTQVVAYEAHAGALTPIYVEEHIRTLRRVMPARREEWEGISTVDAWEVTVRFVAHAFADRGDLPGGAMVDGTPVAFEYVTFQDFLPQPGDPSLPAIAKALHAGLNAPQTPSYVRERYARLADVELVIPSSAPLRP